MGGEEKSETGGQADVFLRSSAALIDALLFMALSLPAVLLLPPLISRMDASVLVPTLPGIFFLEGLLPGFCFPVFMLSLWTLASGSTSGASITAATPLVWTSVLGSLLAVNLLYHVLMESSRFRGTLGKLVVGIKVADCHGGRASFLRVLLRNSARLISNAPFFAGYLMAARSRRRQALHDRISSCLVIEEGTREQPSHSPETVGTGRSR